MKKLFLILTACLLTSPAFGFQPGSGFNDDDVYLNEYSVTFKELSTDPDAPTADDITLYAKDDTVVDSYTTLLLHGDATPIVDSETTPKVVTMGGSVAYSTAQKKFGTGSILFNGTTDYLSLADSDDWNFGSGDFTIDFWANTLGSTGTYQVFYGQRTADSNNNMIDFSRTSGDQLRLTVASASVTVADYRTNDALAWTIGEWKHIALVRNGSNIYIFVGGVSQALDVLTAIGGQSLPDLSDTISIGARGGNSLFSYGYLEEFRVSKGIARWTSDFTPPTSAYYGTTRLYTKDSAGTVKVVNYA